MQVDGSRQERYLPGHCFFFKRCDRLVPGSILHSGDSLDGSAFFMGQDDSTWSWGQGTGKNLAFSLSFVTATVTLSVQKVPMDSECSCVVGINAGVMLLQPNQWVFNDMLAELSEPNHPEHCVGNGPEQET